MDKRPFIFLDRDDTLIYDVPYLSDPSLVKFTPGAEETLGKLKKMGYGLVLVTNQSGIGRGYFTEEQMHKVNGRIQELLAAFGGELDAVYFCPHAPDVKCHCRKPETGMLEQACRDFDVDLENSYMIGDKSADIELGKAFGIKTVQLLLPGKKSAAADFTIESLPEFIDILQKTAGEN